MQKNLAFGTASNPIRHAETLACDIPRGPRKVTTGNVGNAANLIFLRHDAPATPSKG
jgi:hypothetical protein